MKQYIWIYLEFVSTMWSIIHVYGRREWSFGQMDCPESEALAWSNRLVVRKERWVFSPGEATMVSFCNPLRYMQQCPRQPHQQYRYYWWLLSKYRHTLHENAFFSNWSYQQLKLHVPCDRSCKQCYRILRSECVIPEKVSSTIPSPSLVLSGSNPKSCVT